MDLQRATRITILFLNQLFHISLDSAMATEETIWQQQQRQQQQAAAIFLNSLDCGIERKRKANENEIIT